MKKEQAQAQAPISKEKSAREKWHAFEVIGIILVAASLIVLLFAPNSLANFFNVVIAEVNRLLLIYF